MQMSSRTAPYSRATVHTPGRSLFNLSQEVKFTADMGYLYPVDVIDCVPGDVFNLAAQDVVRFQPLTAPVLHRIDLKVRSFFVPYRLLWADFETFITGGASGSEAPVPPRFAPMSPADYAVGSLYDFFGFQPGQSPLGVQPLLFPWMAYNMIWNEYFRDETLDSPVVITDNMQLAKVRWSKDYFTSSLPWQQRGTPIALPVSISGDTFAWYQGYPVTGDDAITKIYDSVGQLQPIYLNPLAQDNAFYIKNPANGGGYTNVNLINALNNNSINLSNADITSFDVADLRYAVQLQRFFERSARAGSRYTEFLRAHFGVAPRDERLQRPEFIGGLKAPIIISEVLKTSTTDTTSPQGNMAGHGLAVDQSYIGKYRCEEYGCIMTLLVVQPVPAYTQGIPRQWIKPSRWDWYYPELVALSEQGIYNAELVVTDSSDHNKDIFGYQGRYDEMRTRMDRVAGEMRTTYAYWHLGRIFSTDHLKAPALNSEFLEMDPWSLKRIFAVPGTEESPVPDLVISHANIVKALRPLPIMPEPGLVDHF